MLPDIAQHCQCPSLIIIVHQGADRYRERSHSAATWLRLEMQSSKLYSMNFSLFSQRRKFKRVAAAGFHC